MKKALCLVLWMVGCAESSASLEDAGGTRDANYELRGDAATVDGAIAMRDATVVGDATVIVDAGASADATTPHDASADAAHADAGGIIDDVRMFATERAAADTAYTAAVCRCSYAAYEFASAEACETALARDPVDDCTLTAYSDNWDDLQPRAQCFIDIANDYATCMSATDCGMSATEACDNAWIDSFSECLTIAQDASDVVDAMCGA